MARVLIYSLVFPPDGVSTAQLMGELAEDLRDVGHEVNVITTRPHYNRDLVAEEQQPLRRKRWGFVYESIFRGIAVSHINVPPGRQRKLTRIRGWLQFHVLGFLLALRLPKADVIIVPSPLLTAGIVAKAVTAVRGGAFLYNVQEMYPDLAVQMGQLKNPLVIVVLRLLERMVYKWARAITCISKGMAERLVERGVLSSKVHFVPNFVDLEELHPMPRDNPFARVHQLLDHFVVSYAGNIGHAQGIETVVEAAELSCDDGGVRYLLVGSGVLDREIEDRIAHGRLRNVVRLPHQPYALMPEIYSASDVCLVPLLSSISGSALPSKVFRIMACGRPIVAICDPGSELGELVSRAGAGVVVRPGRPQLLREAVKGLAGDPERCRAMGRAGRSFVENGYERSQITARYSELIDTVAGTEPT